MIIGVLWYLVIGIVVSAFASQKGIARIVSYEKGEAILVSGSSKVHAAERARKSIEYLKVYEAADASKTGGLIVGGFIATLLAWPGSVYASMFYREHVRIQNGVVLD